MTSESAAHILKIIGERMARMGELGSDTFFLYLETEEGVHHPQFVQEFDDRIQDVSLLPISRLLYDLWLDAEPRWGALRFELKGDKFSAKFDYDVDPADNLTDERSLAAVKKRFPDKPMVYLSQEDYRRQQVRHQALFGD